MNHEDIAIGVYPTHQEAEDAVKSLQRSGFAMRKLSIIGKDYHSEENVVGYFNAGERAKFFGKFGAFWGSLAGILFGSAFLVVPVLGHVILLGPINRFLLIIHGTTEEISRARDLLHSSGVEFEQHTVTA